MLSPLLASEPPVRSDPRELSPPRLSTYVPPRADADNPPLVLIAEDHEDSRDALQTLLEALGYRVAVAGNGAQAVEVALAQRPDLVLMDMMMPEVDGFAATRMLRADPAFGEVPIIAITAMEGARESVLQAGCSDMVLKPVDIRAFLEKLRVWLGSGQRGPGQA
ncbi:MAG TPA: response regulator [Longimicrobium sp.]|nr:response regulator [Longimicrobium sp.]